MHHLRAAAMILKSCYAKKCGMGALEVFPFDPMIIYNNNNYYDNCGIDVDAGYSDYDVSSEHGVLWAAELVKNYST